MGIEFNKQQQQTIKNILRWYKSQQKQVYEVSGIAGSGKTTIVYHIIDELGLEQDEVLFMAYVGKATLALNLKGNKAQTIHSTIYDIIETPIRDELGEVVTKNNKVITKIDFVKKQSLPKQIKLLVIDEGRMVSKKIAKDILSYGIPTIVLGDCNQLDPPFGEPYFLNKPDSILTQPMRQSLNSPILYLANCIINDIHFDKGTYGNKCFVIDRNTINNDMMIKSDIIICGRNKTRDDLNNHIRYNILRRKNEQPCINDKIICRKNNWSKSIMNNIFLINGMVGFIDNVYIDTYNKHSISIDFRPDFSDFECFHKIAIDYKFLTEPIATKNSSGRSFYEKFEYGWAISNYLCQGSEWDVPLIYHEEYGTKQYIKKALYTAVTRARKGLILGLE